MKDDSTRITIRIKKDLLAEFRKYFPYRGELTGFITRCIETICVEDSVDTKNVWKQIIRGR